MLHVIVVTESTVNICRPVISVACRRSSITHSFSVNLNPLSLFPYLSHRILLHLVVSLGKNCSVFANTLYDIQLLTKCLSFSFVSFIYIKQKKYQNQQTHHHGHFPLNHPVNPRCILIKTIPKRSSTHHKTNNVFIIYRISSNKNCPRPTTITM